MKRQHSHNSPLRGQQGFTLVEIIAVFLLISVLSGLVLNHNIQSSADLHGAVANLKAHLRYAQVRAMNASSPWGLSFTGNTYRLQDNGVASSEFLPGQTTNSVTIDAAITVVPSASTISFDRWGSPGTTTLTIALSDGTETVTVTVTRKTGFVP